MSKKELDKYKEILLAEKGRLEQEVLDTGGVKDPKHPAHFDSTYPEWGGTSDDDNAAEVTEYADELSIEARLEGELRDVGKALEAIENGTYGVCKYCKKQIDPKRLEARPASSSCIDCKKMLTQEL